MIFVLATLLVQIRNRKSSFEKKTQRPPPITCSEFDTSVKKIQTTRRPLYSLSFISIRNQILTLLIDSQKISILRVLFLHICQE
ncbi:hypothetical protein FDP41_013671 [Naegleria fowleri]|uniref:Uncharacterized protein n=1 Tax=Naegleria fowleri TaxID=5763 RepID=A0A6A5BTD9_NAEFO|nr:uncharacterized protein FDP41_013671 [Naegleria fowleri]KAF0980457.1 hypothetical protein FDP41_013671 [Naegleria fowleri]